MTQGTANLRQIAEAANGRWNEAFNRGDAAAVAASYTGEATVLPATHDVISGSAKIREFWNTLINAGVREHAIEVLSVHGDENIVVEAGKWQAVGTANDGSKQTYTGSVVHVLERQSDGTWKSRLHIWN